MAIVLAFFFAAFPQMCYPFEGPHSLKCLTTMWHDSGCLQDGYNFPLKLRPSDLNELNSMNLM